MNTPPESSAHVDVTGIRPGAAVASWCLIWLTMLVYGAVATPVPAVNEPHYLGKAKHYWDPAWCRGDLLMESSNAHAMFYTVMGYWGKWLSLPQLAWLGRSLGYAVLAWGWLRTHQSLGLNGRQTWWSLLGFLALASWGNFSGEWIIGGIEGKVFSYGFLLLAFADWQAQRVVLAGLWAGLAIGFHPVAGGWGVLAALMAGLVEHRAPRSGKQSWSSLVLASVVMMLAALPGLIPVLPLIVSHDPPHVRMDGTYLQVYYRLAHHLDPMTFSWRSWIGYGGLLLIVVLNRRQLGSTVAGRTWLWIVVGASLIALAGVLAGFGPRPAKNMPFYLERMSLLKFYPFRLFDVVVPLTASLQLTRLISRQLSTVTARTKTIGSLLCGTVLLSVMAGGEWRRERLHKPTVFDSPKWHEVCRWIKGHTPENALIQTPVHNQNFKWFAERAEYVSYKDVPQDNRSLVEWNRRMNFLSKWYQQHRADGIYTSDELRSLRAETGITHILTDRLGPFELSPSYTNGTFRVYDLAMLDESH